MSNKPWELFPTIWKTQSAFMTWLRGGIRRGLWEKHPVKLEFLRKNRIRIHNGYYVGTGKEKTCWGAVCAVCGGTFKLKEGKQTLIEVDHKSGGHSLKTLNDLQSFITNIVLVTEDDLQLICKPCHKAKSYADKEGLSFEEAVFEKQVIAVMAGDEKQWLTERGVTPDRNAALRRGQVREVLKRGSKT